MECSRQVALLHSNLTFVYTLYIVEKDLNSLWPNPLALCIQDIEIDESEELFLSDSYLYISMSMSSVSNNDATAAY